VFAPCRNLGLIVIDEEHETTFKQETAPRYHARDVARKRAELAGIPLVLGSATPTLESWLRVQTGLDRLLTMPRRVAGRPLPPVQIVDVRHDPEWERGAAIGRVLSQQMRQALADGGQVILFLNMRGYSPVIWCRGCGSGIHCPNCDVILSYHQAHGSALCHACGFTTEPPKVCPQCGRAGVLYLGTGTQRLEREVRAKFPGQVCLRMDSDSMRQRGSHGAALEEFRQGRAQILVGTQMIAKGLDFPEVTLVGVVDADGMLHQADLRAGERTFQLIAQVAGRTGRGPRGGRVIVQTGSPDERPIVLAARHDFETFAREELEQRQRLKAPPYTRLARVIVRGSSEALAEQGARTIAEALAPAIAERDLPVRMLGPAPAPVAKLQGKHRFHIQLCSPDRAALQNLWRDVQRRCAQLAQIEHVVDVDAISLR